MHFELITLFPEMFQLCQQFGILGRAVRQKHIHLNCINPRDFTSDAHQTVDDRPFGGGPGMVMKVAPLVAALEARNNPSAPVIAMSPQGRPLKHRKIQQLSKLPALTLVAGRYEGFDQRFLDHYVDEEISIGDFVVSGGEMPIMLLIDAVARLLPGVLGTADSAQFDSFSDQLLDHPHYTRPSNFKGWQVPDVLLSGDHKAIQRWRRQQAEQITAEKRPDLYQLYEKNE